MYLPVWLLLGIAIVVVGVIAWLFLAATGRNPLPFPDPGSRIFTAASPEAKDAIVGLLASHGLKARFEVNTPGVRRTILMDGTIINFPSPEISAKLDQRAACIGLVAADPAASAAAAADFLRARGFDARVVHEVEPDLPIAFVVTNAMAGTVLNFRPHVIRMPRPKPAR